MAGVFDFYIFIEVECTEDERWVYWLFIFLEVECTREGIGECKIE